MAEQTSTSPVPAPESVTGVQLAQGIGQQEAKGFWADAWSQVFKRPGAVIGMCWVGVVLFFAIYSPILASGHPLLMKKVDETGKMVTSSPLLEHLSSVDIGLMIGGILVPIFLLLPSRIIPLARSTRAIIVLAVGIQIGVAIVAAGIVDAQFFKTRNITPGALKFKNSPFADFKLALMIGAGAAVLCSLLPMLRSWSLRGVVVGIAFLCSVGLLTLRWDTPLETFQYRQQQAQGTVQATYTLIPFSPGQTSTRWFNQPPMTDIATVEGETYRPEMGNATFLLGTDVLGADVLTQLLHASRLSISIGLVSTGLALMIGITMGALMGYFGGGVDMLLFRVLEVFMSVPVLFLLIVAAGVLPQELRSTYVMMAIIGCFTWTGAARFTRAEFMKLRNQDFVQSAKAVGLPLRAIMFKHMLPNGVTPVLVEASFMIASAILIEAILSFLGLGPVGQPSWGKLLNNATGEAGDFLWWLAIFPGGAIFFTVLSYNLIGEALRDAIDPKLRKARV
ncbi:MAG: ABC transporter permease [Phycisphaeraceae bacterium]|nr:ABC transporter permease [Phycisphaerales bacterium]MCB9861492.1 ABC transporter permease [Phycisphaeraceae bacterium]